MASGSSNGSGHGAGGGMFVPPNFGHGFGGSDFNPFGCGGLPISPEVIAAGLRGLFTNAAPFLHDMADDFDERMIDQAIRMSLEDTGREPQAKAGSSTQMKATMNSSQSQVVPGEDKLQSNYRVEIVLGEDTQPESLKISRKDLVMTIDVKKQRSAEDGSSVVYQEYTKKVTLPENVDLSQLESTLTPEGVLIIQAPFLPKPEEAKPVPVKSIQIPVMIEYDTVDSD